MQIKTHTSNITHIMARPVYFIASIVDDDIALGHDMRSDFAAHTCGTRDELKAHKWLTDLRAELPQASLYLFSTPSFVLDEAADLTEVA